MQNLNFLVSDILTLSSVVPSNLFLKITKDGIQNIDLSFSQIPIDFVVSVASPCSTLAHYTSGYLTKVKLNTNCVVLDGSYDFHIDNFVLSSDCDDNSNYFLKGSLNVFASAMNNIEFKQNTLDCDCVENNVEWDRQTSPKTTIYVEGMFNVNGNVQALTGISNSFKLVPYNDFYQLKRQNENITMVNRMQRLVLDEKLKNNNEFWAMMEGMMGDDVTDLNYSLNEKTANFANNINFIDTFNYKMIKKVKRIFGKEFQSFEIQNTPESIERLLEIGTIDTNRLFGHKCQCNMNFGSSIGCGTNKCGLCKQPKSINNLGRMLVGNDVLSAGHPIIYKSIADKYYNIIYPTVQNGLSAYPLGSLTAQNIDYRNDVCFYEWNQQPQSNIIGNYMLYGDKTGNLTRLMPDDKSNWDDVLKENLQYVMLKKLE